MDNREYVKRLKSMLENRKEPCACCPVAKNYNGEESPPEKDCKLCQNFNGLKFIHHSKYRNPKGNFGSACPCWRPGKLGAVTRALKKIEAYEAKHGEV